MKLLAASFIALCAVGNAAPSCVSNPKVHVRNGTYVGVRNENYQQDFFLGMPYAQQPVGNLRFRLPQSLNESWEGERDAKEYSPICVGYGTDSIWYPMSEACLTINVIRGSSVDENSKLPVGVWIHGGGFYMGSGSDQRYNMSAIVANSYEIGKPFIAVSFNYRLSGWGFLSSQEVVDSGITNLGLRDQRLALHWIQENIAAFGGDPAKVTIWGESAGGMSVGYHLTAYDGRDDGLFRGAIMQSGGSIGVFPPSYTVYQGSYDGLVSQVKCSDAEDTLQCLREVPFETLNAALNGTGGTPRYSFSPVVDGDLIPDRGSVSLREHKYVKVPIIAGTNTDEGTGFGPRGINTTEQFYEYLTGFLERFPSLSLDLLTMKIDGKYGGQTRLPDKVAKQILRLYPDDPCQGIPEYLGCERVPEMGYQWRRTNAYAGDVMMHANRRFQCEAWAETSTPAYCYRFNVHSADVPLIMGATHFEEVAFVFHNLEGLGYHYGKPFEGTPELYKQLSKLMTSMWASFIHDLDPNSGIQNSPVHWDPYGRRKPVDLLFDANVTSHMEPDTWRKKGIAYINSQADVYDR